MPECGSQGSPLRTYISEVISGDTDSSLHLAGWRRFQSVPVYALEDANGRQRMLKYTPEHMHCLAVIWGALAPPNTGAPFSRVDVAPSFRLYLLGLRLILKH